MHPAHLLRPPAACLPRLPAAAAAAASPVDSILDKESYTLEELLDEDELIQECKSLNARLTAYLKQKETVERLVRVAVAVAAPAAACPQLACQLACRRLLEVLVMRVI